MHKRGRSQVARPRFACAVVILEMAVERHDVQLAGISAITGFFCARNAGISIFVGTG